MKQVYCDIARGLAVKHRYGEIRVLLQCIQSHCQGKVVNMDAMNDDIVMAAIKELSKQTKDVRDHVCVLFFVVVVFAFFCLFYLFFFRMSVLLSSKPN